MKIREAGRCLFREKEKSTVHVGHRSDSIAKSVEIFWMTLECHSNTVLQEQKGPKVQ